MLILEHNHGRGPLLRFHCFFHEFLGYLENQLNNKIIISIIQIIMVMITITQIIIMSSTIDMIMSISVSLVK